MIILNVTKNQGLTLSLEDTFFEKPQGRSQIDSPSAVSGLKDFVTKKKNIRITLKLDENKLS